MSETLLSFLSLALLALASWQLGLLVVRFNLPYITGYLIAGILAGPYVLELFTESTVVELHTVEELSLAFIAFVAGSELYLKDLQGRLRGIAWVTLGLVVATYSLISVTVYVLADMIPFMADMSDAARLSVALLAGAIMVARSPSSAIAIITELRARGTFTKTVLGVTVVMDIVVIIVFAISSSFADVLLTSSSFDIGFVILLVTDIGLALLLSVLVSYMLRFILSLHIHVYAKTTGILLLGLGVFEFATFIREYSHEHFDFEILIEPLLVAVIASFILTNFTRYRVEMRAILGKVAPYIFVVFFTITGASLRLDVFRETFMVALILFSVRLIGIGIGSFAGGTIAGDSPRQNRFLWMGFVTQAGVALGLAREVAVLFPELGDPFATMIISVVVLNESVGPLFMKYAIRRAGESHEPAKAQPDEFRDALVLGIEQQSIALAHRLQAHNWQVVIADSDPTHVEQLQDENIDKRLIDTISIDTMSTLMTNKTDAVVALLHDDSANLRACEIAKEKFGIKRVIVRLNDPAWAEKFQTFDAIIVDPASAMVNLFDQFVRAPQSTAMLLERDAEHTVAQITVTNPDIDRKPLRDVQLPIDVVVLAIMHKGRSIVPHGHTVLHLFDEVTVLGLPSALEEVTLKLGY